MVRMADESQGRPEPAHDTGESGSGPPVDSQSDEPHGEGTGARLNWLRAGVLGANDGIVSTGSIVVGVAGAAASGGSVVVAGLSGLFAGAMSMAAGEFVSVSGQRDVQRALLHQERQELRDKPEAELAELARMYRRQGLSRRLARQVAEQRTEQDALSAHAEAEFGIDPGELQELTNPWRAALTSFLAFALGAILPLLAIALTPTPVRVVVTVLIVAFSLLLTGAVSSRLGGVPNGRAIARNLVGGLAVSREIGPTVTE